MKLSRGKPQVTTQPTPAKAVYVQTTDGSYWNGQQFVWPLPETGEGAFDNAYDALAFVLKAQDSPKMKYEEEDLRVVLRDQERSEEQLVITADQSQLLPVLVERWEKHLGVPFDPDALQVAQARISAEELPAFFMTGAPEQDNHHERNAKPLPLSPLQQLMAENSASPSPMLDEAPADDLPTSQVDEKKPNTATVSPGARPERPAGFDKIEAQRSFAGRLIAHGEAPYNNDKQEKNSYFVTFEHNGKEHTLWGKDLPNALAEAQVAIGDHVQLDFVGSQPVQVRANVLDDNGKKVGEEWQTKNFNMWRGKAVDADYCANFTLKEKPLSKKNAPAAPLEAAQAAPLEAAQKRPDGGKFGNKKPAAPSSATDPNDPANQRTTMVPSPGKAGAGIGAALGNMLGGIHRAGSSFASKLSGADKRDLAQRQNVEQHEQLLSAMTHSASRASAAATALAAGELAPVMAEIKQQGLALDDVLNTDKHPDLKEQYSSVMNKHGGAVKAALGEFEWYATQAAESAKERGINIQPEVDEAIDKVKEDAKDIALPDEQGKWSSISDMLDKVLEKVHELIRQIFARFSPNSAQS